MIIWGTRGMTSNVAVGEFHCPRCGPQRFFNHKQVKRWFTLYFIPIIPMGSAGEYVECQSCGGTFGMEARDYNPQLEHQKTCDEIRRILVLTAMAHGPITEEIYASLIHVYAEIADVYVQRTELEREVALARSAGAQLTSYVQRVANDFTVKGKKMVLASAYAMLCPSGGATMRAETVLRELAAAMQLPTSEVQQFLGNNNLVRRA